MDSVLQDIRFAFRTLRRDLPFASVAVLILALGIGTATAIFAVVNAVLIKPLPYVEPSQLVAITSTFRPETENRSVSTTSLADIWAWRRQTRTLSSISGFFFTRSPVRVGETSYYPDTLMTEPGLLATLGTPPVLGTDFDRDSTTADTVIISHAFWQRAFGGAPDIVGRALSFGPETRTVRGVLPADFEFPRTDANLYRAPIDVLAPLITDFTGGNRASRNFWGIARLAPDASVAAAQSELRSLDAALDGQTADDWSVSLSPLMEERTRAARQPLAIFVAIGAVLLLIMCTNLLNLLLARNVKRAPEMSIRAAIGATQGRLWRQQLTESLCIAALGAALGIGVAAAGARAMEAASPLRLPVTQGITLDPVVLFFGFAVAAGAMLFVGLVPAWLAQKGGRTGSVRARAFPRTQKVLTIAQVGVSIGLLATAGVLAHSLWRLNTVDRGFDTQQVLGLQIFLSGSADERVAFLDRALEAVDGIPGVDNAAFTTFLPPETWSAYFQRFELEGPPPDGSERRPSIANTIMTSPSYFDTVGMSIRGRQFRATDDASSLPIAIVNEAFAKAVLGQEEVIGRRIVSNFDTAIGRGRVAREIVGVVSDARDRGMNRAPTPTLYVPYRQGMLPYGAIALGSSLAPSTLIPEIRRRLGELNPDVPLTDFETLDARVQDSLREPRFYVLLAAICAALAVLFAGVGLYGVVAYTVVARTTEFGVRMALGSSRGKVLRLVLWQGIAMALVGSALGLLLALVSMRGLASLLFEVAPLDPPTLAAAVLFVVGVALIAAFVPAWRACQLSPMTALRHE